MESSGIERGPGGGCLYGVGRCATLEWCWPSKAGRRGVGAESLDRDAGCGRARFVCCDTRRRCTLLLLAYTLGEAPSALFATIASPLLPKHSLTSSPFQRQRPSLWFLPRTFFPPSLTIPTTNVTLSPVRRHLASRRHRLRELARPSSWERIRRVGLERGWHGVLHRR